MITIACTATFVMQASAQVNTDNASERASIGFKVAASLQSLGLVGLEVRPALQVLSGTLAVDAMAGYGARLSGGLVYALSADPSRPFIYIGPSIGARYFRLDDTSDLLAFASARLGLEVPVGSDEAVRLEAVADALDDGTMEGLLAVSYVF